MGGACSAHGGEVECIQNFDSKGKRPLRRPRQSWKDNIKMNLRKTVFKGAKWICLAQDRDCTHSNEHLGSTHGKVYLDQLSVQEGLSSIELVSL
jgi:hypothetical protein